MGANSDWFRGVRTRHERRIRAAGLEKNATFVEIDTPDLQGQIDDAYRKKYSHYPKEYVDACITPQAHAATLKLELRP